MNARPFLIASTALSLVVCVMTGNTIPVTAQTLAQTTSSGQNDPASAMRQLFTQSDESDLKRNPLNALYRGDMRYAGDFGDGLSDDYIAAERQAAREELAQLNSIDRKKLSPDDQIIYDTFKWQRTNDLRGLEADLSAIRVQLPLDHFNGTHIFFPDLSSGEGAAPYKTVEDYQNGLSRIAGFVRYLDMAIVRFREGVDNGVTQPVLVVNNMIGQIDGLLAQGIEGSTFYGPIMKMPTDFAEADKSRLTTAYRTAIMHDIIPAFTRLRTYLANDYLPHARQKVGISEVRGGEAYYAWLVERETTTQITPDDIHTLGLNEVARIKKGMDEIRHQVGFKGTLGAFFNHLRTDPQFKLNSVEALRDGYRAIGERVAKNIPNLFSHQPKAPLEIRPVPAYIEKNSAGAYYMPGTPDGSRPGIFYFNSYDLPSRTTPGMETLYLHEAVPGHHFQISLAQEDETLPSFLRFGGNTAYVEGWALYAESLGNELGLLTNPYQRFGSYDDEMLRAMRLVVDTGLHTKGWTRDQAIAYMLANSGMSKTDAIAEVERYIAYPAQALSYKVGQLTIRKLRTHAETELGTAFDIRAFHDQVLMTGALPLDVLSRKIDRWIADEKTKQR